MSTGAGTGKEVRPLSMALRAMACEDELDQEKFDNGVWGKQVSRDGKTNGVWLFCGCRCVVEFCGDFGGETFNDTHVKTPPKGGETLDTRLAQMYNTSSKRRSNKTDVPTAFNNDYQSQDLAQG